MFPNFQSGFLIYFSINYTGFAHATSHKQCRGPMVQLSVPKFPHILKTTGGMRLWIRIGPFKGACSEFFMCCFFLYIEAHRLKSLIPNFEQDGSSSSHTN